MTLDLHERSTPTSPAINPHIPHPAAAPNNRFDTDNKRWHTTQSKSRAADPFFIYGFQTTKIFCRPSCASRRPSRRPVISPPFPTTIEAAEKAGSRPCQRWHPQCSWCEYHRRPGLCEVLRLIIAETFGKIKAEGKAQMKLAKSAGLSTFHFHRMYKATTPITLGRFHTCLSVSCLARCSWQGPSSRLGCGH